jgi:hypothetical protein
MSAADAILVERSSPETEQCVARALNASPLRAQMVDEEEAYRGYAWYDGLARLEKFRFDVEHDGGSLTITDAMAVPVICDHLCASKITFCADLHDQGRIYPIAEDADVAFVTDDAIWAGLEAARIIYRDTITPEDLTDLLDAAYFCASDDSACDSWDTQHRAFEAEARECAVKLLCGPDEAICDQFRCLLQNNRWLLPEGASLQISVSGDNIDVALSRQQVTDA